MKISQEEIDAAHEALSYAGYNIADDEMDRVLEAAYTVRRARKHAKRERQRKEKDKQVVESVKPHLAPYYGDGRNAGPDFVPSPKASASQAPEWDGTFGVGEWETRGGIMATVIKINANNKYPLSGNHGTSGLNCWWNDQGVSFLTKCRGFDLIRPWPKSEQ